MSERALITDIQRFAVNDGPGFRTLVFLKGCALRCSWCHNPEAIASYPEIYWKRRLCAQCGACLDVCPLDAISPPIPPEQAQQEGSTYHKIIRERCNRCMKCVGACHYGALVTVGKPMTIEEILNEVESDRPFYDNSGGGMTLSGGEPTLHAELAGELLEAARQRGLHICLDTSGYCDWEVLERLIKNTDIVLFDIKHIDPEKHRQMTGVSNEAILQNLTRLAASGVETWVRIPVIPGLNDSVDLHDRVAGLISGLPGSIARIDLLPFHNWCENKYDWLGINWKFKDIEAVNPFTVEFLMDCYKDRGLNVTIGGSGFENFVGTGGSGSG